MFNRLVGRRAALVHDTPGSHVTRDYKEGVGMLADLRFKLVDTSGLDLAHGGAVQARAARITAKVHLPYHSALLISASLSTSPL
jgi:predicted GTPase